MNTQWLLKTYGDPLKAVRKFIRAVWQEARLDGMLAPLNESAHQRETEAMRVKLRLIADPDQLEQVNPFKPLMTVNVASLIPKLIEDHPEARLGAMLRPCEMRALIEVSKYDTFELDWNAPAGGQLLTICIDCLGTFPADEYQWWAARKGSTAGLTQEALQFARQGGIVPYRYRSACQMCLSPKARGADLNIGVLGLPVRQYLLVHARDEGTAERLRLETIADGEATSALVTQRARLIAKLIERHSRARERVTASLAGTLPANLEELMSLFAQCGVCQACLKVCPIWAVDVPQRGPNGKYGRDDLVHWLAACAGCGMCEQACPKHLPLSVIFAHLRDRLISAQPAPYVIRNT